MDFFFKKEDDKKKEKTESQPSSSPPRTQSNKSIFGQLQQSFEAPALNVSGLFGWNKPVVKKEPKKTDNDQEDDEKLPPAPSSPSFEVHPNGLIQETVSHNVEQESGHSLESLASLESPPSPSKSIQVQDEMKEKEPPIAASEDESLDAFALAAPSRRKKSIANASDTSDEEGCETSFDELSDASSFSAKKDSLLVDFGERPRRISKLDRDVSDIPETSEHSQEETDNKKQVYDLSLDTGDHDDVNIDEIDNLSQDSSHSQDFDDDILNHADSILRSDEEHEDIDDIYNDVTPLKANITKHAAEGVDQEHTPSEKLQQQLSEWSIVEEESDSDSAKDGAQLNFDESTIEHVAVTGSESVHSRDDLSDGVKTPLVVPKRLPLPDISLNSTLDTANQSLKEADVLLDDSLQDLTIARDDKGDSESLLNIVTTRSPDASIDYKLESEEKLPMRLPDISMNDSFMTINRVKENLEEVIDVVSEEDEALPEYEENETSKQVMVESDVGTAQSISENQEPEAEVVAEEEQKQEAFVVKSKDDAAAIEEEEPASDTIETEQLLEEKTVPTTSKDEAAGVEKVPTPDVKEAEKPGQAQAAAEISDNTAAVEKEPISDAIEEERPKEDKPILEIGDDTATAAVEEVPVSEETFVEPNNKAEAVQEDPASESTKGAPVIETSDDAAVVEEESVTDTIEDQPKEEKTFVAETSDNAPAIEEVSASDTNEEEQPPVIEEAETSDNAPAIEEVSASDTNEEEQPPVIEEPLFEFSKDVTAGEEEPPSVRMEAEQPKEPVAMSNEEVEVVEEKPVTDTIEAEQQIEEESLVVTSADAVAVEEEPASDTIEGEQLAEEELVDESNIDAEAVDEEPATDSIKEVVIAESSADAGVVDEVAACDTIEAEQPVAEESLVATHADAVAFDEVSASDTTVEPQMPDDPVAETSEDAVAVDEVSGSETIEEDQPVVEKILAETSDEAPAIEEVPVSDTIEEDQPSAIEESLVETTIDTAAFAVVKEVPPSDTTEIEQPIAGKAIAESDEDAAAVEKEPATDTTVTGQPIAGEDFAESSEDALAVKEVPASNAIEEHQRMEEELVAESSSDAPLSDTIEEDQPVAKESPVETTVNAPAIEKVLASDTIEEEQPPAIEEPLGESIADAVAVEEEPASDTIEGEQLAEEEPVDESNIDVEAVKEEPTIDSTKEAVIAESSADAGVVDEVAACDTIEAEQPVAKENIVATHADAVVEEEPTSNTIVKVQQMEEESLVESFASEVAAEEEPASETTEEEPVVEDSLVESSEDAAAVEENPVSDLIEVEEQVEDESDGEPNKFVKLEIEEPASVSESNGKIFSTETGEDAEEPTSDKTEAKQQVTSEPLVESSEDAPAIEDEPLSDTIEEDQPVAEKPVAETSANEAMVEVKPAADTKEDQPVAEKPVAETSANEVADEDMPVTDKIEGEDQPAKEEPVDESNFDAEAVEEEPETDSSKEALRAKTCDNEEEQLPATISSKEMYVAEISDDALVGDEVPASYGVAGIKPEEAAFEAETKNDAAAIEKKPAPRTEVAEQSFVAELTDDAIVTEHPANNIVGKDKQGYVPHVAIPKDDAEVLQEKLVPELSLETEMTKNHIVKVADVKVFKPPDAEHKTANEEEANKDTKPSFNPLAGGGIAAAAALAAQKKAAKQAQSQAKESSEDNTTDSRPSFNPLAGGGIAAAAAQKKAAKQAQSQAKESSEDNTTDSRPSFNPLAGGGIAAAAALAAQKKAAKQAQSQAKESSEDNTTDSRPSFNPLAGGGIAAAAALAAQKKAAKQAQVKDISEFVFDPILSAARSIKRSFVPSTSTSIESDSLYCCVNDVEMAIKAVFSDKISADSTSESRARRFSCFNRYESFDARNVSFMNRDRDLSRSSNNICDGSNYQLHEEAPSSPMVTSSPCLYSIDSPKKSLLPMHLKKKARSVSEENLQMFSPSSSCPSKQIVNSTAGNDTDAFSAFDTPDKKIIEQDIFSPVLNSMKSPTSTWSLSRTRIAASSMETVHEREIQTENSEIGTNYTTPSKTEKPLAEDQSEELLLETTHPNISDEEKHVLQLCSSFTQHDFTPVESSSSVNNKEYHDFADCISEIIWSQNVAKWKHEYTARMILAREPSHHFTKSMRTNLPEHDDDQFISSIPNGEPNAYLKDATDWELHLSSKSNNLNGFCPSKLLNISRIPIKRMSRYLPQVGCLPLCLISEECEANSVEERRIHIWPSIGKGDALLRHEVHELQNCATLEKAVDVLHGLATSAHADFKKTVQDVAIFTANHFQSNEMTSTKPITNIKSKKAMVLKARRKYGGDILQVKDVLMAQLIFPDEASLVCALMHISKTSNAQGETITAYRLVRLKNLFRMTSFDALVHTNLPTGYRHVLVNLELPNGLIVEIQLNLKSLYDIEKENGYNLHKEIVSNSKWEARPMISENKASFLETLQKSQNQVCQCANKTTLSNILKKSKYYQNAIENKRIKLKLTKRSILIKEKNEQNKHLQKKQKGNKENESTIHNISNKPTAKENQNDESEVNTKSASVDTDSRPSFNPLTGGGIAAAAALAAQKKTAKQAEAEGEESSEDTTEDTDSRPSFNPLTGGGIATAAALAAQKKAAKQAQSQAKESSEDNTEATDSRPSFNPLAGGGIAAAAALAAQKKAAKQAQSQSKESSEVISGQVSDSTDVVLFPSTDLRFPFNDYVKIFTVDDIENYLSYHFPDDFSLAVESKRLNNLKAISKVSLLEFSEFVLKYSCRSIEKDPHDITLYICLHHIYCDRYKETKSRFDRENAINALSTCLEIINNSNAVGMVGWLGIGDTHHLDRCLELPFETMSSLAAFYCECNDLDSASSTLRSMILRCENYLPLYHPITIAALLDLSAILLEKKQTDDFRRFSTRAKNRLYMYTDEQEEACANLHLMRKNGGDEAKDDFDDPTEYYKLCGLDHVAMFKTFCHMMEEQCSRKLLKVLKRNNPVIALYFCFVGDAYSSLGSSLTVVACNTKNRIAAKVHQSESKTAWTFAAKHYKRALVRWTKLNGTFDPDTISTTCSFARALHKIHKTKDAIALLSSIGKKCMQKLDKADTSSTDYPKHRINLAQCFWMLSSYTLQQRPTEHGRVLALGHLRSALNAIGNVETEMSHTIENEYNVLFHGKKSRMDIENPTMYKPLEKTLYI